MSAGAADRQDSHAGGTARLSSAAPAATPRSIARYRILSELGRGAMARVYLALDPNINRKVALKVLEPRNLLATLELQELKTRFLLEARAAGNLRHPAAVAVYDADHDADSGASFIAMEWVDGESLEQLLRRQGALPPDEAIAIIAQVAGALDAAHAQGLIHRDVKPANILLDRQGNAKLSDFGIAKAESLELTSTGQVLGTPYYMSPEQIRDEELDGRSDLFSLGVVLYQCITGKQPFHADSLPALTHKILNVDPAPPESRHLALAPSLAAAVVKALDKDPERRFQSGADLVAALTADRPAVEATVELTRPALHARARADGSDDEDAARNRSQILRAVIWLVILAALATALWKSDLTVEAPPESKPAATSAAPSRRATTDSVSTADPSPSRSAVSDSTLQISYTNRLKKATLEVRVDGDLVLTRSLHAPRGLLKRAVGRTLLESIPVSAGRHDVEVSIRGDARKIEASNRTTTTFAEGQTLRLRVELIPPSYLNLAWK